MAWVIVVLALMLFWGGVAIIDGRWPLRRVRLRWWYRRTAQQIARLPVAERIRRDRERP